ncbi:MAG TPA: LuxR C-terminal-related transcriptional regulator [Anaerolineaceae bacterium]|nr:LuxR C-terminal-related transcriptional regulator [Anaerolineaceae bacterium]
MEPSINILYHIPQVSVQVLRRERLFHWLEAAQRTRLILVSAPAGYGKTVLLADWLRSTRRSCAWVIIEEKGPSLQLFWQQIILALRKIMPGIGEESLDVLRQASEIPIEPMLTRLTTEMAGQRTPLWLVLDDYHHVQSPLIHSSLRFFLEHSPDNFHLILSTRVDPPLPLARYRARSQMVELHGEDLRFSEVETGQLLQCLGAPSISANAVALLYQRTEGWAAGIQLSSLAIQKQANPDAFITAFSGSQKYILDYLTDEILANLARDQKEFLLKTSILRQLSSPLCAALVAQPHSQAILEQLYQQNIFLQTVDEAQEWFRYHGLFRDVLQYRLKRAYPAEEIKRLHHLASVWYRQAGWGQEALHHALVAEDFELAGNLIENMTELLTWSSGFHTDLIHMLEALPEGVIRSRPLLQLLFARALLLDGRSQEAVQCLEAVEQYLDTTALPEEEARRYRGMALTHRATQLALSGEAIQAKALAHQALEYLPPTDLLTTAQAIHTVGVAADAEGRLREAAGYYRQAGQLANRADHRSLAVTAASQLAFTEIGMGELRQAEASARRALEWAVIGTIELPVSAYAHTALAEVLRQQNRLPEAEQEIQKAVRLAQKAMLVVQWHACLVQANICFSLHDPAGAQTILQQNESRFQGQLPGQLTQLTRACLCRFWLAQDRLDLAEPELAVLEQRLFTPGVPSPFPNREAAAFVLCRGMMATGRGAQAREKLQAMYALIARTEQKALAMEALILLALGAENRAEARVYLQEALVLAEPGGYQRVFMDEGRLVFDLLEEIAGQMTVPSPFLNDLLDAFHQELVHPIRPDSHPHPASEFETLTGRELEVLALIARGDSNQEIANRLVVSIHTVKKHAANIFLKLGVENRTEAVARARSLGLL